MCDDGDYNVRQSQDKTEPRLSPALEGEELSLGENWGWGTEVIWKYTVGVLRICKLSVRKDSLTN